MKTVDVKLFQTKKNICQLKKLVSMTRKFHDYTLQTNPRHSEVV